MTRRTIRRTKSVRFVQCLVFVLGGIVFPNIAIAVVSPTVVTAADATSTVVGIVILSRMMMVLM